MMSRTLGAFYACGGIAGELAVLGDEPDVVRRWLITGVAVGALAVAGVLLRWGHSWSRAAFHVPVVLAIGMITLALSLSSRPLTALAIAAIICFISVFAYFFFRPGQALVELAVSVVAVTAGLLLRGDVPVGTALALDVVVIALAGVARVLAQKASGASRDALTGLVNRRGFDDALQELLAAASRGDEPLSAALLDLDHFKQINDTDGHEAGDAVLVRLAGTWRAQLPDGAVLARHGGDEFALLLPGLRGAAALAEVERLAALHPAVGVSGGVAQHVPGETAAQLMRRADGALYSAKEAGRGRCALDGAAGCELSADLAAAVAAGAIDVAFQPLVAMDTGRVFGVEALARWTHPTRGPVGPDEFIPIAEQSGLVLRLGAAVLRSSLAQLTALRADTGRQLRLGINVSVRELADPTYPQRVAALLAEFGWPPDHLTIEVTESLLETDASVLVATLEELLALGAGVAVDDFGTGYSSLSRLDTLPVGHLKLDTSFVATLTTSPRRARMVASVIALADALGLGLVAEGVETVEQHDLLRQLGCRYAQGWLYGRPMPLPELCASLTAGGTATTG